MKLGLIVILMVLLSSIVLTEETNQTAPIDTYNLEDFAKVSKQAVWLKTDDFVFFNLLGKKNAIRIDLVYEDNAKIVLYPDTDSAPQGAYAPIKQGQYIAVDLNKDDVTDMAIRLEEIESGEWGDEGLFVFESLVQDENLPKVQGLVVSGDSKPKSNNTLLLIAAGIGLLLGLLVVLAIRKHPPQKENPVQKTE